MSDKLSERDLAHLQECYGAYGLGESIRNGHLTEFNFDSSVMNEATTKIEQGVRIVENIYRSNV